MRGDCFHRHKVAANGCCSDCRVLDEGDIMMTVTDTMVITLVVTGSATIYLIVHAALDVVLHRHGHD